MRLKLLWSVALLFLFSCEKDQPAGNTEVDQLFSEWNKRDSPGCALVVVKDGQVEYEKGYGIADLEHNVPIQPSTVFYCGSVSKQFVTFSVLLLEEQGKLSLDDDIRKYFPDFPDYGHTITINNLIHHTSGIRDYLTLWDLAGRDYLDHISKYEVYEMIKRQKELNFVPGERYLYSNSCYFMLSEMIEKVSGQTLHEFAQENIFGPLGMTHSHFHDNYLHLIPNRAFSYSPNGDTYNNLIMRFDQVGSGGLYSSVEDLYLWDRNFYQNTLGKGGQAIMEKMHEEGMLNNGESSGYAFALVNGTYRGLRTVSHTGALAGYRAVITRFPDENFSVIILSNVSSFNPARKAEEVADLYLGDKMEPVAEEKEQDRENDEAKLSAGVETVPVGPYTGRYYSAELDVYYEFMATDEKLMVKLGEREPQELVQSGGNTFSGSDGYLDFQFIKNNANEITGFTLDAGRVTNLNFEKVK